MSTNTTPEEKPALEDITKRINEVLLDVPHEPLSCLVDTAEALSAMLDAVQDLPSEPPSIFIDVEGENLSRDGTVSILQLYSRPADYTYLIDIHTLQGKSFSTRGTKGSSLKELLESSTITKVFFDVRNDSDALFALFDIRLSGIQDLQLMELAARDFTGRYVAGLAKCIENDGNLSWAESKRWKECKEKGVKLFAPERGGSYNVFNERPLSEEILQYCIQDVCFMPRLWRTYNRRLTKTWWTRVRHASAHRVALSQSAQYKPHGKHKALAPKEWAYFR